MVAQRPRRFDGREPALAEGIPTAIRCGGDRPAEVRHVIGAVPVGDGFGAVDAIDTEPGRMIVRGKEARWSSPSTPNS